MANVQWASDAHLAQYEVLRGMTEMSGPDVWAALYVLAILEKRIDRFVDTEGINFPALMNASKQWSNGEMTLVRLAATLFNPTVWMAPLDDLLPSLDAENFEVAVQAFRFVTLTYSNGITGRVEGFAL